MTSPPETSCVGRLATPAEPAEPTLPAEERVILVDARDRAVGTAEKVAAHREGGLLHRAFSVFLFDDDGRMLLQQRAAAKYHFPRLWTNACCGHPRPGEPVLAAAARRVGEELGVAASLRPAFTLLYEAADPASGLAEREFDHVLLGRLETEPRPAPEEIEAVALWAWEPLRRDVRERPERYTPWFQLALDEFERRGFDPSAF